MIAAGDGGHAGRVTLPVECRAEGGAVPMDVAATGMVGSRVPRDRDDMPVRKRLDHRGPLSIDVSDAWYFITICADGHRPWVGSRVPRDRTPMDFDTIANALMSAAQWYHEHGKWHLSLFVVMPDHLHLIAHFPTEGNGGHAGRVTLPMVSIIQQFKSYLARTYGLAFQRGFFDTRIRDDAHYAEKFEYVCNNPVRKGFCAEANDWPYIMVFDRTERSRGTRDPTAVPRDTDTIPVGSRVPRDRDNEKGMIQ